MISFPCAQFRGRHASKLTEEEEDEEYLKEEEDGLSGNTRLVTQPSCKLFASMSHDLCLSVCVCLLSLYYCQVSSVKYF